MTQTITTGDGGAAAAEGAESLATGSRAGLAGLSLAVLLASLGTSIANVALPALAQAFGATFQAAQWVVLAYLLASTAAIVGAGRLGDLVGRRRLLLAGIALYGAASLLGGLASSLWLLLAARAAQGVAAAVMMALAMALVGSAVPRARAGSAMGLLGTMSAVGTALGPTLGGLLIVGLGWRAVFLVNLPLGALAFLLARSALPADEPAPNAGRAAFDSAGTALLAVALASFALAMTAGRGEVGPLNLALLVAAAGGIALFLRVEARAASPLVPPALLRDPRLAAGLAMNALVATVMMATLVVGPFYLARGLGLAPASAGLVLSLGPLVAVLAGVPAGRVVDRVGASRMTLVGLGAMAAGCAGLALLPAAFGLAGYAVPIAVLTAGYAAFAAANNTAVLAVAPSDRRGTVSGLLNLSRNLGLVTGSSAMGALFALAAGGHDPVAATPAAVAAGLRATFAGAALLVVAALALAARRPDDGGVASPAGRR